jgi:hypothetical protein
LDVPSLFYMLKKESSTESHPAGPMAATQDEDHPQSLANKTRNLDAGHPHFFGSFHVTASIAYLSKLNPEQRRAAEYGVGAGTKAGPLLVIAGAGSGKTNTLAHRVAHLIVGGADPRRILLLTFSRRAAAEMTRRVERICAQALGEKAGILAEGMAWAWTFHAIGAKLLRD